MKNNETINKYTAGLFDSEGSISFLFYPKSDGYGVSLKVSLTTTEGIDFKFKTINCLQQHYDVGAVCYPQIKEADRQQALWQIQKHSETEKFIPHIAKHMIIKGRHFKRMLEKRRELIGVTLSERDIELLKVFAIDSRNDAGSLKPKNHPSDAWLAGMVDGGGCLHVGYSENKHYWRMRMTMALELKDSYALRFIQKAYKGFIYKHDENTERLEINLGFSNSSGALKFLRNLVPHLRMKKHKAEMMIHMHTQRLNGKTPTGEVIV